MCILGVSVLCDEPHKVAANLRHPGRGNIVLPVNESVFDRDIRLGVGLLLFLFGFFGLTGIWQIVLTVVAVLLIVSAVTGFCPIYALLHVKTTPAEHGNK